MLEPLFEFSGACAGCGETPYLKLMSQLFGDRALIANATGCSSIYGGNLPTTPWSTNADGRGPTWSNSLFEDNAEFGLGLTAGTRLKRAYADTLLRQACGEVGDEWSRRHTSTQNGTSMRLRDSAARRRIEEATWQVDVCRSEKLATVADTLVRRSVWIVGGDGWAFDIGFGGLDHVLHDRSRCEHPGAGHGVYSNTGGQMSKATPRAAVAKFAARGKPSRKKDLGMLAVSYGNAYVAQIAMGSNPAQTVRAFARPNLIRVRH